MSTEKIAVVAGGTAGVGRATVDALVAEGYKVGVIARGRDRLAEVADAYGARVMTLPVDVGDAREMTRAASAFEEGLGPIDVWINCAMLTSFSPFDRMAPEEFERIVDTTFLGVVNGTRAALSLMKARGVGKIVTVGSGLGYRSVPWQSAYCASKHAINGFLSSVRSELIHNGSEITIGVVQLPAINTPQFDWAKNRLETRPQPAPPIYQPELAARAVLQAVRDGNRELLVGQSVLQLVFGDMVLPDVMDRVLARAGTEQQKSDRPDPGDRPDNLHRPVESIGANARGSYGDSAQDTGLIVDGDQARMGVFFGLPLVALGLGLAVGSAIAKTRLPR
ncbi:short-chain dehydrogenase/reductase SDR [Roseibacterium elongatum DSM 19469]|uniref:Short-chain dehydrogenase/reductase SDR n=1 Tax=Roseicyclus elongatus DSM 19469 TaxID=1294273 RepID=W8SRE5_9RHOB|nr:SDR family oxidoreductase [Roseibacterium elongatum]AHM05100.1 short-chain dehydrogenase/reductase SDR [Roseibacterium elongatum DSM 19469]